MLTDFFLWWLGDLAVFLAGLLPSTPSPPDVGSYAESAASLILSSGGMAAAVVPINHLGAAVVAVASVQVVFQVLRVVIWLLAVGHIAGSR